MPTVRQESPLTIIVEVSRASILGPLRLLAVRSRLPERLAAHSMKMRCPNSFLSRFGFCLHFPYGGREERGIEPKTCREVGENLYVPLSTVMGPI